MATDDAEGLVAFQDVRVIRSTAPALLCRIGERSVWLPRGQLSGGPERELVRAPAQPGQVPGQEVVITHAHAGLSCG